MPISKEDDKSSREQYHIILLSHIVMYWIWSLLDSDVSLLVTWVCQPIFGLQHCCRFRKQMQLNMGGFRLNNLFSTNFSIIFFFTSFSFSSISLPSTVYIYFFFYSFFFYFLLQRMLILLGLSWCHKFQLHFMSLMPQIKGTFIKIERFKMKPWPSQKKMTRLLLSHIVLYWIWSLLDSGESFLVTWVSPPIFGLQHCCRFRKRMQLNMGGFRLNTLFSTTFSIIFFFTSFYFSSISLPSAVYFSSFFSILSFSILSFNVCWSFLASLCVINFNFISCPSCLK